MSRKAVRYIIDISSSEARRAWRVRRVSSALTENSLRAFCGRNRYINAPSDRLHSACGGHLAILIERSKQAARTTHLKREQSIEAVLHSVASKVCRRRQRIKDEVDTGRERPQLGVERSTDVDEDAFQGAQLKGHRVALRREAFLEACDKRLDVRVDRVEDEDAVGRDDDADVAEVDDDAAVARDDCRGGAAEGGVDSAHVANEEA